MPAIASPATWRTHPQIPLGFLWIHVPDRVIRRRVNQSSFVYPLTSLAFDNPDADAGDTADVWAGMTLKVSDSSGNFKGWARVRAITGTDTGTLTIGVVGQSEIDFADNDYLDVMDEFRIWSKPPYITSAGAMFKDRDMAWSSQTSAIPPLANCDLTVSDFFIDPDTEIITVEFDATGSTVMAEGGAWHVTEPYTWDLGDGTRTEGGEHDAEITATFPKGQRYVHLTVKDDNDETHTKHLLIPALDTDSAGLYPVIVSRLGDTLENGWEASFSLLADDASAFPEGARVLYFEQEFFGATEGSLDGYCLKFDGWVVEETQAIEPLQDDVVVNCRGPMGVLHARVAFPQTVEVVSTPDNWYEIKGNGWWEILHYALFWHSTALDLYNLEKPADVSWETARLDLDMDTLKAQLDFLANAVRARFTCDKRGVFYVRTFPPLMTAAERAALTTIVALADTDWSEEGLQLAYRAADEAAWVRGSGLDSDATPYLSISSESPGQGAQIQQLDRQLVTGQSDLNARTGRYYAWLNHLHDGARVTSRLSFPLMHRGLVFDSAWLEWVTFTLDAATNKRGRAFAGENFFITSVECTYDHARGVGDERLTLAQATDGVAGVTIPVPAGEVDDTIPSYPPIIFEDPIPPATEPTASDLVYAATRTQVRRSRDFTNATPTWTNALYTPPSGWTIKEFRLNQFNPRDRATLVITDDSAWTAVVELTNLDGDTPVANTLLTLNYRCYQAFLTPTPQWQQTWFLGMVVSSSNYRCVHTHDDWASYADVLATSGLRGAIATAFGISYNAVGQDNGDAYAGYWQGGANARFARSTNFGATFPGSIQIKVSRYQPAFMLDPWWDNDDNDILFAGGGSASTEDAWLYYSDDGGGSWANITPFYDGEYWGGGERSLGVLTGAYRPLHSFTTDLDILAFAGYRSSDKEGRTHPRLFTSIDRGQNWTHRGQFGQYVGVIGGWPYNQNVLFATGDSAIEYSTDFGASWAEKQWAGYADGVDTIPVWVE